MTMISLFLPSNTNKFITYTIPCLEKIILWLIDWLFIYKTKPKGRVQVFQEGNNEVNTRDDVIQIDELVYTYQVILSHSLGENSNFCVIGNIFADVDVEELNDVLRTN